MKIFMGIFPNTEATKELLGSYDMKKSTGENPIYTQVEGVKPELDIEGEPTGNIQADIYFTRGDDELPYFTYKESELPENLVPFNANVTGEGNNKLGGVSYQKNKF